jgi:peptidoglycan-associated lipoprotein
MKQLVPFVVALGLPLAGSVGCNSDQAAKKPDRPEVSQPKTAPKVAENQPASIGGSVSAGPEAPSSPIYFAFDSDELTEESRRTLKQMAEYLRANPKAALTIEGHCDESGSAEYNLALGDRRARAAMKYLRDLGVDQVRLNTISYGEEKPAVAGSDEASRAKNRRGEFAVKG